MLEQGFSFLLKKFLGEFVEDGSIIQENLQVAAWSGCIILEQLVLKKEALSLLNVPLALTHGSIGRIEIQIPWASLGVDPVIISIEKICLLLEPKYEWNPDSRENKEHALKQAKLAALELFAKRRAQPSDDPWKGYKDFAQKWLLESVVSKIVDKVQVTVSDIHIRYEDHVSCPSSFSVGLTLERVQAKSRDELDEDEDELLNDPEPPTAIDDKATPQESSLMKVVELRQLSVYWNPLTHSGIAATTSTFTGRGRSEIQTLMLRTIARGSEYKDRPKHHYILLPTDITITMAAAIDPAKKTASGNVQIAISDIGISFEDRQFREAVSLGTNMSNFMQLEKFSGYRPQVPVHHDPAAWWRYAVKAVMFQMHAERRSLSWRQISDRSLDKDVYIELWKYKLCTPTGVLNAALTAAAKMKAAPTKTCSSSPRSTEEQAAAPSLAGTKGRNVSAEKLAYRSQALFSELLAESRARRKSLRERLPGRSFRPPSIPVLNADTAALLMALERKLTFEDIVYFRSLAEKELAESGTSVNRQGWMDGALSW
jgi:vacuolar protein sorting-associated protein 13A/C